MMVGHWECEHTSHVQGWGGFLWIALLPLCHHLFDETAVFLSRPLTQMFYLIVWELPLSQKSTSGSAISSFLCDGIGPGATGEESVGIDQSITLSRNRNALLRRISLFAVWTLCNWLCFFWSTWGKQSVLHTFHKPPRLSKWPFDLNI